MTSYVVGSGALEHRCQCCGEVSEGVFCDDCLAHMAAQEPHASEDLPKAETG